MKTTLGRSTPGPWALRGYQIRADNGLGAHVASYQICSADGKLIAAAPELFAMLLSACSSLDAAESGASAHGTACDIRARLAALGLIVLPDNLGSPGDHFDPIETITGDAP